MAARGIKRDLEYFRRGMRQYAQLTGEQVYWFQYDLPDTTEHYIYDEGPSRRYYGPSIVPCIFVAFREAVDTINEEGRYTVNTLHFTASTDAVEKAGIANPLNADVHFYDRIQFSAGTGTFLFKIESYQLQGYVNNVYQTVGIDCREVKPEELQEDLPLPSAFNLFGEPGPVEPAIPDWGPSDFSGPPVAIGGKGGITSGGQ